MALKIVGSSPIIHPILFRKRRMKMRRFRFIWEKICRRKYFGALGGRSPPLVALPMGELARLKAVTERAHAVANMKKVP